MGQESWRERIVSDPDLHGGEPCVRETRIPVSVLFASLADMDIEELLLAYPQLTQEDVQAVLLYAAEAGRN
jgi:uncharacterized protein (DUF433 family)